MKGNIFKIKESSQCIDGEVSYYNNEFIFESNAGRGEFSLMIGKGFCELSIAKFDFRVYSFGGVNIKKDWLAINLKFPDSIKGELYVNDIITRK